MPNMSLGQKARYVASITNRPTCGGDKKVGLLPNIGRGSLLHLRAVRRRGYNAIKWPVNCAQAIAAGMPLSVNPQCSGGVGRSALRIGCGLWRW